MGTHVVVAVLQTPPFQVPGVAVHFAAVQLPVAQVPPFDVQEFFDVYCDLEQALLPVQLLWVVSAPFEQVPAAVQVLWLL